MGSKCRSAVIDVGGCRPYVWTTWMSYWWSETVWYIMRYHLAGTCPYMKSVLFDHKVKVNDGSKCRSAVIDVGGCRPYVWTTWMSYWWSETVWYIMRYHLAGTCFSRRGYYPQTLSPPGIIIPRIYRRAWSGPVSDHYLFWHLCWKLVYIWELVLWVGMKPWYYPITTKSLVFTFCLVCGCFKSVIIPITTKSSHVCFKQSLTLVFVPFSYPITTIFLYIVFFVLCVFVIVFWILCVCFFVLGWRGARRISVLVKLPARFAVITNQ